MLIDRLHDLLTTSLPGLLAGATPPVTLAITAETFTPESHYADTEAGEPRTDDQVDLVPFNSATPAGPYTLVMPPAPGARRVALARGAGDLTPLTPGEVAFDALNSQSFTLALRADRDLAGVTTVQVRYGVTAVFTRIVGVQTIVLQLRSADPAKLAQAEALVIGVVELNRKSLVDQSVATFTDGDYTARVEVKSLKTVKSEAAGDTRTLRFSAQVETKASRALRADEGKPILRIKTPGVPDDPARPVDISIGVQ